MTANDAENIIMAVLSELASIRLFPSPAHDITRHITMYQSPPFWKILIRPWHSRMNVPKISPKHTCKPTRRMQHRPWDHYMRACMGTYPSLMLIGTGIVKPVTALYCYTMSDWDRGQINFHSQQRLIDRWTGRLILGSYTSSRNGNVCICFSLLLYRSDCGDCRPSSSDQLPSRD